MAKEYSRKNAACNYLSLIELESVIRASKKYYLKHFWKGVNMK